MFAPVRFRRDAAWTQLSERREWTGNGLGRPPISIGSDSDGFSLGGLPTGFQTRGIPQPELRGRGRRTQRSLPPVR